MSAQDILRKGAQHIDDRAAARDQAGGERSMARTVAAFNALTGHALSERDGWLFMVQLKAARATNTPTGIPDDYEDMAAYSALAGECVSDTESPTFESITTLGAGLVEVQLTKGGPLTVPPGYKWIAQDRDGGWNAYTNEPSPHPTGGFWTVNGGSHTRIGDTAVYVAWDSTLRQVRQ